MASELTLSTISYRQIVEQATDALFIADREGRFIQVNRQACASLGYSREELLGLEIADIEASIPAGRLSGLISRALAGEQMTMEGSHRRKDGTVFPVEIRASRVVLEDRDCVLSLVRDISQRRQTEEALLESEERFHQLFVQNEDAIILCQSDSFDIIDANRAASALYGYPQEELLSLNPCHFMPAEAFQTFIKAIPQRGEQGAFRLDHLINTTKNGDRLVVSIWGKVLSLRRSEVIYCSIRDITEKARFEEELRRTQAKLIHTNKMTSLGMLVSGIAHEINNPNTFIGVNATILGEAWQDAQEILQKQFEEQGEFTLGGLPFSEAREIFPRLFQGLNEGSRRITTILAKLKDFARENPAGGAVSFSLNDIVRDAVIILGHAIHSSTENFQAVYGEHIPPVRGNAQQMEQVVINLLLNALQALPSRQAGVRISTGYLADQGVVLLSVQDEGCGMSRAVLDRITEPFFTTRLDQGGTGLGLSIAAAIVKEHQGTMEFTSKSGSGTFAVVRLPSRPSPAPPADGTGDLRGD